MLCYFASFLAVQKLSPQTIKTYLAGIRHTQISLGLPEPRAFSSLPRLQLVQRGIQRSYLTREPKNVRLPITPAILHKLHGVWSAQNHDGDTAMLWAAALVCFYGFCRAGEISIPSLSAYEARKHLSWGDVMADSTSDPKVVQVHIKYSKTDQLGTGAHIYLGKTGGTLCPVAGVMAYMVIRGNGEGPFFVFKDGSPLTKPKFTERVRDGLQRAGLPYLNFAGHSFRIGAATTAAKAGIEDSTIQILGRWSSAAFLSYVRTPRKRLANLSATLANS